MSAPKSHLTRQATKKIALALLLLLTSASAFRAQTSAPSTANAPAVANAPAAPDYAKPESWVCLPGKQSACTDDLDMLVYAPTGKPKVEHFIPAAHPPIDCFYVYPTVGGQDTMYADMRETAQVRRAVHVQAGRFSSLCRVFAPIYRQGTMARLNQRLAGKPLETEDYPQRDVIAAWDYYFAHYNQGRGVVLISHSQGTGAVLRLIAARLDGQPAQKVLISAFLAGAGSLAVPPGKAMGGTLQHIPVCSAAAQVGCVYVWGTYADADPIKSQNFGRPREDGLVSACENPAAPGGGSGLTRMIHPKLPGAPESDPPFVEYVDQVTGACKPLPAGDGFRVSALPGPNAAVIDGLFQQTEKRSGWGLHGLDIMLVQGNMLSVVAAESATWTRSHSK